MSTCGATVAAPVTDLAQSMPVTPATLDEESRRWLVELGGTGSARDAAVDRLHALLLRAARFEVSRRRHVLSHLRGGELDEVALEAADDALVSVLAHLSDFRGASRFTTWVFKFALLETAVKIRKRAWQGREVPLEPESWESIAAGTLSPADRVEQRELLGAVETGLDAALTPHQRRVLTSLAIDGVPIDVLADRLSTTRGALYKTLHDARAKLRTYLHANGFDVGGRAEERR